MFHRRRSRRGRRWPPETQHGFAVVERIGLVPEETPYDMELSTHPEGHGEVERAEETSKTLQALAVGQVRRALRHGVEHNRAVHDARREPPRRRAGRRLDCLHQKFVKEAHGEGNVVGVARDDAVVPVAPASVVPPREWRVVATSIGGREDVVQRVDEGTAAAVVVRGLVAL